MELYLFLVGILIVVSLFIEKISERLGVPALLFFLLLGILSGNGLFLNDLARRTDIIDGICAIALVFIMFYGGFGTNIKAALPVWKKAFSLASVGVFITVGLTALFCRLVLGFDTPVSLLLGSVLGSTDAASVFNILRYKKLALKNRIDSLLELESGSNDPFAYICTLMAILYAGGRLNFGFGLIFLLRQVGCGVLAALLVGWIFRMVCRQFRRQNKDNQLVFVAAALFAYALAQALGGNGYLATYIVGILLGRLEFESKPKTVHFFDGITSLMQLLLFYLLGLLIHPAELWRVFPAGLAIMLFLTVAARPAAVLCVFRGLRHKWEWLVTSFAGIRGAASIVFAMMAVGGESDQAIYHIVAIVVLLSLMIQGTCLPMVVRKADMLEQGGDVRKTFNDYVCDEDIRFIVSRVEAESPWCGRELRQMTFPPDVRVVAIRRGSDPILPDGSVVLEAGDELVLSGLQYPDTGRLLELKKITIDADHDWADQKISDLDMSDSAKVFLIERAGQIFIPTGDQVIRAEDRVLVSRIRQ